MRDRNSQQSNSLPSTLHLITRSFSPWQLTVRLNQP